MFVCFFSASPNVDIVWLLTVPWIGFLGLLSWVNFVLTGVSTNVKSDRILLSVSLWSNFLCNTTAPIDVRENQATDVWLVSVEYNVLNTNFFFLGVGGGTYENESR